METILKQLPFLKATRFWALVAGAVSIYAKSKGWFGPDEMMLITTIMGGFIAVRTVDRYSEQAILAEAVGSGQIQAATVLKVPPAATDSLTDSPTGPRPVVPIILLALLLGSAISCAKAPPDLTPEASIAFRGTQVVKALDLLRDTAVAANAQVPPLLATDVTRKVVLYHQSTVKIIQSSTTGWTKVALSGLDEATNNLSAKDRALLAPYIALIKTVIQEVTQ